MIERAAGSNSAPGVRTCAQRSRAICWRFLLADRPNFPIQFAVVDQTPTPDGGTAWALEGKGPGEFAVRLFIDCKTLLPLMMANHSGDNGHRDLAQQVQERRGRQHAAPDELDAERRETERLEIKKVKINPKFPDDKFVKPSGH